MNKVKRIIFPFGIFFLLLILLEGILLSAVGGYFYISLKQDIYRAEYTARAYLSPLLEVCARCAAIGEDRKVVANLAPLFADYRAKGMVYRAFFVKENGEILVHSDPAEIDQLKNNIASDEFSYNIDQIFSPLNTKSSEPLFIDYNIIDEQIPFSKKEIRYIKKYLYKDADRNGWLLSRAVFRDDKPYGVVAFIIDKDSIYQSIKARINDAILWTKRAVPVGILAALILAIIVYFRYAGIAKSVVFRTRDPEEIIIPLDEDGSAYAGQFQTGERPMTPQIFSDEERKIIKPPSSMILDAIPIRKRVN
jgi:hypothetical protein